MRKVTKAIALFGALLPSSLALAAGCDGILTGNLGTKLPPIGDAIKKVTVPACDASAGPSCASCVKALSKYRSEAPGKIQGFVANDRNISCNGTADVTAAAAGTPSNQTGAFGTGLFGTDLSSMATQKRKANSTAAHGYFGSCTSDVYKGCNSIPDATAVANAARVIHDQCKKGQEATAEETANQSGLGSNLGDMAKTLASSAQLLGAASQLAGLMNKQDAGSAGGVPSGLEGGATSPTGSSINDGSTQKETSSSSLAPDKTETGKVSLGALPAGSAASASASQPGFGAASGTSASSGTPDGFATGASLGANDPAASVGAKGTGAGGGAGGGMLNGTGASRPFDGKRDPAAESHGQGGNYELNVAGGLSNRASMMGLKAGGAELDELGGAAAAGKDAALDSLGTGDTGAGEGTKLASADEGDPKESIFLRLHTRYESLARKGRF